MGVRSRIVGVGRPTVDRIIAVPQAPTFDAGLTVRSRGVYGGGPVATALVAATRLGWETALIARIGEDEAGQEILRGLTAEGVDTRLITVDREARSATSTILVDPSAARAILHDPGEGTDPEITKEVERAIRSAAGLMLERWTGGALAAARIAKDAGVPVLLDAGGHDAEIMDVVALSTVVIAATYHAQARGLEPEAAVWELRDAGVEVAIVTLGEAGAIGIADGELLHEPAFPIEAVDTTGAGDVYHGAFYAAFLEGKGLREAMRFAAVTAALKCRKPGGRAGIPTRAELEERLGRGW